MGNFANSEEVRELVCELHQVFNEPNDLLTSPRFSPEREDLVRAVCKYTRDDIPDSLLDDFAWCLVTTIGTTQTLQHYLPRIFEEALFRNGLNCTIDWWIIVGKLQSAVFEKWVREKRRVTLAALKLCIITSEIEGEFDAPTILHMQMKDVVGLYDPYYGTTEPWWGRTYGFNNEVAYLIEQEGRLQRFKASFARQI